MANKTRFSFLNHLAAAAMAATATMANRSTTDFEQLPPAPTTPLQCAIENYESITTKVHQKQNSRPISVAKPIICILSQKLAELCLYNSLKNASETKPKFKMLLCFSHIVTNPLQVKNANQDKTYNITVNPKS